jgi:hypothetical protein
VCVDGGETVLWTNRTNLNLKVKVSPVSKHHAVRAFWERTSSVLRKWTSAQGDLRSTSRSTDTCRAEGRWRIITTALQMTDTQRNEAMSTCGWFSPVTNITHANLYVTNSSETMYYLFTSCVLIVTVIHIFTCPNTQHGLTNIRKNGITYTHTHIQGKVKLKCSRYAP